MLLNKAISKEEFLYSLYSAELKYINQLINFQDFHYANNGEIVVLFDQDFPGFDSLDDRKIAEIISIYENVGWKINKKVIDERAERLIVFS